MQIWEDLEGCPGQHAHVQFTRGLKRAGKSARAALGRSGLLLLESEELLREDCLEEVVRDFEGWGRFSRSSVFHTEGLAGAKA